MESLKYHFEDFLIYKSIRISLKQVAIEQGQIFIAYVTTRKM